jgi:hypothetical protein
VVREDLLEVIEGEFRRIVNIYTDMNKLCRVVSDVKVDGDVRIDYLPEVENGLPCEASMYIVFGDRRDRKVLHKRYLIEFVSDGIDKTVAFIDVYMFDDMCFIAKTVDDIVLEDVVRDIVLDGLKESSEEES